MMNLWTSLTHFGDITITAPAALAIACWLLAEKEKRLALWWVLLFLGGLTVVVISKIAFIGWGIGIRSIDFTGFSGHAMRAVAIWPVLAFLICQRATPMLRVLGVLGGYAFGLAVGISRLALTVHSTSEVVFGLIVGVLVSAGFLHAAATLRRRVITRLRVTLVAAMLLPAPYVQPAPTQQWLTSVSLFVSGNERPYLRSDASWRCVKTERATPLERPVVLR